jgi:hypothetical protein
LRILPFLIALCEAAVFTEQLRHPLSYPWLVLIGVCALPLASLTISWGRVRFLDMLEKMTPTFVLIACLAFALLLAEGRGPQAAIVIIASLATLASLELLFLLAFNPARYPVHGLSRVNIAYVPIAIWYAASTSSGLLTFLQMSRIIHVLILVALGAVLFRTTGHPQSSRRENTVWSFVGAIVGANVGMLGLLLPLSMPMQGIVAVVFLCAVLRARRYKYDPKPPKRQAWTEAVVAIATFTILLITAKWL